jgi:NAD(P)-dependent dehydrogenase (short-subunit alcohol dehydrogenase family)
MNRLADRVGIVTGAGEGIGLGVARRFAAEGAAVAIAEFNEETGRRAAAGIESDFGVGTLFVRTDVGKKEDVLRMVDATVQRFGRVDILVNNAWGGGQLSRLEHKTTELMEHGLRVGFFGVFWAMQAVFPHMKANGWGRIITMCSLNGVNAHMYSAEYNAAKEAARTLTRTAAREWARHNITANVICPAAVTAPFRAFQAIAPEMVAEILQQNPMGRMGDPEEDIAPLAVFLASEESRYITGNTIHADGGGHINGVAWAPELPD